MKHTCATCGIDLPHIPQSSVYDGYVCRQCFDKSVQREPDNASIHAQQWTNNRLMPKLSFASPEWFEEFKPAGRRAG